MGLMTLTHPASAGVPSALERLRAVVARLEGRTGGACATLPMGLSTLDAHLPGGGLALAALHEVAPATYGDTGAAFGFATAVAARIQGSRGGPVVLVASRRGIVDLGRPYGPGLAGLGLDPGRLLLVEVANPHEALWAIDKALRSGVVAVVVGAVAARLDLVATRRLHLAAGGGTPLVLLRTAEADQVSAAATRWRIAATAAARDRFGAVARPSWHATLTRCRNGRPGAWRMEWDHAAHCFTAPDALGFAAPGALADHPPSPGARALGTRAGASVGDRQQAG